MEEQLKKLLTDDPSVVESSLEKCAEVAHPEKTGVIRRFVFSDTWRYKTPALYSHTSSLTCFVPDFS